MHSLHDPRPRRGIRAAILMTLAISLAWAASARAEWVALATNEQGKTYMDVGSISIEGHLRRIDTLVSLNEPDAAGDHSYQARFEIDCAGMISRSLSERYYSGPMAAGALTASIDSPTDWIAIAPRTVIAELQTVVCPKR